MSNEEEGRWTVFGSLTIGFNFGNIDAPDQATAEETLFPTPEDIMSRIQGQMASGSLPSSNLIVWAIPTEEKENFPYGYSPCYEVPDVTKSD